jgi:glycosyltransferase involved in cell wall biosynthesis
MTRRPIVALVCDVVYPYSHGGREIRNQELLPRLAQRVGMNVYTMHWWDGPPSYSDGGVTYHAISPLLPLYRNNRRSLRQALGFGFACLRLLRCDFDVLETDHIPYLQVFILRLVATLKRKPFIVTWHEVWSRAYWCQYLGWAGWIAWLTERLAVRLPDHIFAASPQTAERLSGALRRHTQVTIVPNGIDLDLIREVSAATELTDLVVVGRLIEHKRVDMLLDAVASLRASGMRLTCRIIGNGPERDALEERARNLGIAGAVEFRDDIENQKELYSLVKAAKVFVSLSAREGFGLAILEAIACGIPVLTTSAPDNLAQHLVARYSRGTVCEPTPKAVTAAIHDLAVDADLRTRDECDTDSWLAEYDWSAMADRIEEAYRAAQAPGSGR